MLLWMLVMKELNREEERVAGDAVSLYTASALVPRAYLGRPPLDSRVEQVPRSW